MCCDVLFSIYFYFNKDFYSTTEELNQQQLKSVYFHLCHCPFQARKNVFFFPNELNFVHFGNNARGVHVHSRPL